MLDQSLILPLMRVSSRRKVLGFRWKELSWVKVVMQPYVFLKEDPVLCESIIQKIYAAREDAASS